MNIALFTTSGFLIILLWAHLIFTFLWMSAVCLNFFGKNPGTAKNLFPVLYLRIHSIGCILSGALLLYFTPSDFHSSWGASVSLGSLIGLVMLFNQFIQPIISGPRSVGTATANFIFLFPVTFFMAMASHMGIQVTPRASLLLLLGISMLPIVLTESVILVLRPARLQQGLTASVCGIVLTGLCYILLEIFSK